MTQEELNAIAGSPDPDTFFELEVDKTIPMLMGPGNRVTMTITLRKIQDGKAFLQITYDPSFGRQTPNPFLRDVHGTN